MTRIFIALGIFLSSVCANAATLTIERLSDTEANITMAGTLDNPLVFNGFSSFFSFNGATTIGDFSSDPVGGGDFLLGGASPKATFARNALPNFVITFNTAIPGGTGATGTLLAILIGETWAPIGTMGTVADGLSGTGLSLGTYTIVGPSAVPLPAAAWLFLTAIGALGGLRRFKRA